MASLKWIRALHGSLREAILRALQEGDLLPEKRQVRRAPAKCSMIPSAMNSQAIKDLLDKLTERLANEAL